MTDVPGGTDSLYNGEIPGGKDRPVTHRAPINPPPAAGATIPTPILVACVLTLVLYLGAYMRLPLVPLFARGLGASTVDVGMINAGFMLAAAALALPLGLMSDRLGRKRLILAGMGISCLTSLFLLVARTPLHVGLIYLFSGVGLACFSPAMMSHVGDSSPPNFLGRAYGWYTSALYLGMALGPGFGGAVATKGFGTAFAVSAAIIGAGVIVAGFRVGNPAPPAPRPSAGAGISARTSARSSATGPSSAAGSPPSSRPTRGGRCSPSSPFTRRTSGSRSPRPASSSRPRRASTPSAASRSATSRTGRGTGAPSSSGGTPCSGSASPSPERRGGRCRSTFSSPASAPRWRRRSRRSAPSCRNRWPRASGDWRWGGTTRASTAGSWPPRPRSDS